MPSHASNPAETRDNLKADGIVGPRTRAALKDNGPAITSTHSALRENQLRQSVKDQAPRLSTAGRQIITSLVEADLRRRLGL